MFLRSKNICPYNCISHNDCMCIVHEKSEKFSFQRPTYAGACGAIARSSSLRLIRVFIEKCQIITFSFKHHIAYVDKQCKKFAKKYFCQPIYYFFIFTIILFVFFVKVVTIFLRYFEYRFELHRVQTLYIRIIRMKFSPKHLYVIHKKFLR